MSKLKSPREKKIASLLHDRRNTYGENAKSSRKNIALSKQLSRKATRRMSHQSLQQVVGFVDEDAIVLAEVDHLAKALAAERNEFTKWADTPLGDVLEYKRTGKFPAPFRIRSDPQ